MVVVRRVYSTPGTVRTTEYTSYYTSCCVRILRESIENKQKGKRDCSSLFLLSFGGERKKNLPICCGWKRKAKEKCGLFFAGYFYFSWIRRTVVAFYFCGAAAAALHSRVRAVSFFNGRTNG